MNDKYTSVKVIADDDYFKSKKIKKQQKRLKQLFKKLNKTKK